MKYFNTTKAILDHVYIEDKILFEEFSRHTETLCLKSNLQQLVCTKEAGLSARICSGLFDHDSEDAPPRIRNPRGGTKLQYDVVSCI